MSAPADRDEDASEGIYKVDTIPPPAGEDDAYSAPTKVGPMARAAVAHLFADADLGVAPGTGADAGAPAEPAPVTARSASSAPIAPKPPTAPRPSAAPRPSPAPRPSAVSKVSPPSKAAAPPSPSPAPASPSASPSPSPSSPSATPLAPSAPRLASRPPAAAATPTGLPRVYDDDDELDPKELFGGHLQQSGHTALMPIAVKTPVPPALAAAAPVSRALRAIETDATVPASAMAAALSGGSPALPAPAAWTSAPVSASPGSVSRRVRSRANVTLAKAIMVTIAVASLSMFVCGLVLFVAY
jgi:hypothetical protein